MKAPVNTARKKRRRTGRVKLRQADYERLAEFRYLLRRFLVFSADAAKWADLPAQQHQALLAIRGHRGPEPFIAGTLAERLAIRHQSAVGLIDRLAAKRLIRRSTTPIDRRQVGIALTPAARTMLQRLAVAHREELQCLAPLLRGLLDKFDNGTTGRARRDDGGRSRTK